jgi:hypothetical protein
LNVESNQETVLKLLHLYYQSQKPSGKLLDDAPEFFLVNPKILENSVLTIRSSDKLILDDSVQRAISRKGYVGVNKWRNPKLNYSWLELSVFPYMLGDEISQNNRCQFFYVLSHFIEYSKLNPKFYGDLTAEIDSDKDLALMLAEIKLRGEKIQILLPHYPLEMLASFNPNWPVGEVNKLLHTLKGNDQNWCDVFFEHIIYVMGKNK